MKQLFETSIKKRPDNLPTKQRIIEAAGLIFSNVGFENATVREICKQAHVNIAAVNYHFGDKKKLYLAVLKYGKDVVFKQHPFDEKHGSRLGPEDRFRLFVSWYIGRVRECHDGEVPWVRRLITHELLRPTEGLDLVAEEGIRPILKILASIVRELLGAVATENIVTLCCTSVISQSLFFFYAQPMIARVFPARDFSNMDLITDHIIKFSLSGIRDFAHIRKGETR